PPSAASAAAPRPRGPAAAGRPLGGPTGRSPRRQEEDKPLGGAMARRAEEEEEEEEEEQGEPLEEQAGEHRSARGALDEFMGPCSTATATG
ncbi:unnamed protein product, partial [Prorocentrum cordatum]